MLERLRSGKRGERGGKHKGTREHDLVFVLQSKLQRENAGTREKTRTTTCVSVIISSSFSFGVSRAYRPPEVFSSHSVFIFFYQFSQIIYTYSSSTAYSVVSKINK